MDAASAARLVADTSSDLPGWLTLLTGLGLGSLIGTAATLGAGIIRDNRQRTHDIALRSIDAAREKEHWRRTEAKAAYVAFIGATNELLDTLYSFDMPQKLRDMPQELREEFEARFFNEKFDQAMTILNRLKVAAIQVRLVGTQETGNLAFDVTQSLLKALKECTEQHKAVKDAIAESTNVFGTFIRAAHSDFLTEAVPAPKPHS
jgi:hypothetical protein